MKFTCLVLALVALAAAGCATSAAPTAPGPYAAEAGAPTVEVINIWSGAAPGSEGWTQKELTAELGFGPSKARIIRNVVQPTLTAYLPDPAKATGAAVIIAPGGGFMMLSIDSEGHDVAKWLSERGIAAFVLKYRLIETPTDHSAFVAKLTAMLTDVAASGPSGSSALLHRATTGSADATEALRIVRTRAAEWGYSPDRIGLLGFSAGAFITTRVLANPDRALRPDFAAPIYGGAFDSSGVPGDLPPMFVVVAQDDQLLAASVIKMVDQLHEAGQKPAFHLYASGGHGFGMTKQGKASDHWIDEFYWWMSEKGLLKQKS